jgi:hypothetical protein
MDKTTHSVYLTHGAGQKWHAYDGYDHNGGSCLGHELGQLPDGCVDLGSWSGGHGVVRCVRNEAADV